MGKSYELVRKNIEEVVDVNNGWFNTIEEAEEFYFQLKRIPNKEDFNKLYYVRKRNNDTQTKTEF
jgi:hypothetical protein